MMAGERITEALAAVTTAHRDLMVAAERTCRMEGKDPDYAFAVAPFRLVRTVAALENALAAELPALLEVVEAARAVVRGLPTGVATPPYLQIAVLRAALAVLDSTTEQS